MTYDSNTKKYFAISFFKGLGFSDVIFYLFLLSNGLNYFQITLTQAWFSLIILITLIPMGALADLWHRKKILLIGAITAIVGSIIYAISTSFLYILIAETFWGISIAIMVGSLSSFIYESLKCIGLQDESKKIFSHSTFYLMLGGIIAPLIGGFVASTFGLRATMYLMIFPQVMIFFLVLMLEEPIHIKNIFEESFFENIRDAIKFVVKNKLLGYLITINIAIALIAWMGEIFFQPYMQDVGIKIFLFGFIFASVNLASAIFSRQAHWIEESLGTRKTLIISALIPAIGFLAMSLFLDPIIAVIGIAMVRVTSRFMEPVYSYHYNKLIGKNRATINSFIGFVQTLLFTMFSPLLGHLSDLMGVQLIFSLFALVAFFVAIFAVVKFIRIKQFIPT
jgi:predicted MFS family arabinose efflux permease